jgi:hypothetical protein
MSRLKKHTARMQSQFYIRILQIMGIFGAGFLAACVKYGTPVPEYGVPYGEQNEIRFYGNVKSEDSLKNIPGITIRLVDEYGYDSITVTTGSTGDYVLYDYAWEYDKFKLKAIDTDSAANLGLFENKTLNIEISGRDYNNAEKKVDILLNKL